MSEEIIITVKRGDEVSVLKGVAGVAIVMPANEMPSPKSMAPEDLIACLKDMPHISLRCDNEAQLAICLGVILGTVMDIAPAALEGAMAVAAVTNAREPLLRKYFPK